LRAAITAEGCGGTWNQRKEWRAFMSYSLYKPLLGSSLLFWLMDIVPGKC